MRLRTFRETITKGSRNAGAGSHVICTHKTRDTHTHTYEYYYMVMSVGRAERRYTYELGFSI